ncbi:hypothetical protein Tsubulata_043632 [Turnera subulata]|uniref:Nucleoside diphosphate kinase n=1 Tax=Turnera subulata TaxID=218843 RepID=A0A9Q0G380_9ROSI|nr:hypothetical protein Tsubulata_043632 [Turnera subulata]
MATAWNPRALPHWLKLVSVPIRWHVEPIVSPQFTFFGYYTAAYECRASSNGNTEKERTLAMIKPDGVVGNYSEAIRKVVVDSGFSICKEMTIQLDEDRASIFYSEHSSKSFFSSLIRYMTSGPVLVMVLEKDNAITDWRTLIGPTDASKAKITHPHSIRAMCGQDSQRNCVHGSDSLQSAEREISFFFDDKYSCETVTIHDEL